LSNYEPIVGEINYMNAVLPPPPVVVPVPEPIPVPEPVPMVVASP